MILRIAGLDFVTDRLFVGLHSIILAIGQLLRQLIGQLRHLAYIVESDVEYHIRSAQFFCRIILREGQVQVNLTSDLLPDQPVLKPIDK